MWGDGNIVKEWRRRKRARGTVRKSDRKEEAAAENGRQGGRTAGRMECETGEEVIEKRGAKR